MDQLSALNKFVLDFRHVGPFRNESSDSKATDVKIRCLIFTVFTPVNFWGGDGWAKHVSEYFKFSLGPNY